MLGYSVVGDTFERAWACRERARCVYCDIEDDKSASYIYGLICFRRGVGQHTVIGKRARQEDLNMRHFGS